MEESHSKAYGLILALLLKAVLSILCFSVMLFLSLNQNLMHMYYALKLVIGRFLLP